MTKTDITKKLNNLRTYDFLVWNFNHKNYLGTGYKHFVDHVILGKKHIWFIEVKMKGDRMSEGQLRTQEKLKNVENKNIHYMTFDETVFGKDFEICVDGVIDTIIGMN